MTIAEHFALKIGNIFVDVPNGLRLGETALLRLLAPSKGWAKFTSGRGTFREVCHLLTKARDALGFCAQGWVWS